MNVDKFGRHESSVNREILRGPKGEGFRLTEDGNYDIGRKRLCNLDDAVEDTDSINLKSFKTTALYFDTNTNVFNAQGRRITNIPTAVDDYDAVNRRFVVNEMKKLKMELESNIKEISTSLSVSSLPDTVTEGRDKSK